MDTGFTYRCTGFTKKVGNQEFNFLFISHQLRDFGQIIGHKFPCEMVKICNLL